MSSGTLNIAVGIATTGRRDVLARTISVLAAQTRLPNRLVICPVKDADVDEASLRDFPGPALIVRGPVGLPAQRNKILSAIADADVIVFFDDDFFVDRHYIERLEEIFVANPDIVGLTGALIADGAQGPGLTVEQGLELIQTNGDHSSDEIIDGYGAYGCNMAFRMKPIIDYNLQFDEILPLYGWQEDIDFSMRICRHGRIVKATSLRGVHLGIKAGRTSGVRFGYSQMINPIYLVRKGSMSRRHAAKLMSRNIAANLARSLFPEPWVDRKGRLRGNVLALLDVLRGVIAPGRILEID
jgi:GT2 family glycosyltransferase